MEGIKTTPGRYYGRLTEDGPLVPAAPGTPDAVICRRVADYPGGVLPAGARMALCCQCGAGIAFNPRGPHQDRPRACMQCCGIQPLPFEVEA